MATKKKSIAKTSNKTTSSRLTAARTSRAKNKNNDVIIPEEEGDSLFDKVRSGKGKWIVLGLLALALIIFLSNRYLIAAWVNNKPVTRIQLNSELNKRYGKDLLEELIVGRLIEDEAGKRGVSVSQPELDEETKKVEDQQGGAEKLNEILIAQNISRDDFNRLIRLQLLRQKMFGANITIGDGEVNAYLEENKDALEFDTKTASEQAKLKTDIQEQLKNQKVNQDFKTWLDEALKGSNVVRT